MLLQESDGFPFAPERLFGFKQAEFMVPERFLDVLERFFDLGLLLNKPDLESLPALFTHEARG